MRASRKVTLVSVPLLAAAFAACGEEEETAYCVDQRDQVVENRYCDDQATAGSFFWFYGGSPLRGGAITRGTRLTGGDRIRANDRAAIARRGGFGGSAARSGVGRATAGSGGG